MATSSRRVKPADRDAANELVLFIENDAQLYRSMYTPLVKNYAKKVVAKTFRRELAVKGIVNLVNAGLVSYRRQVGAGAAREYGLGTGVSAKTKEAAAKQLYSGMVEEIRDEAARIKAGRR